MKLLLTSDGITTPQIVETCVRLVGKPQDQISFAVINEAYAVEGGDKRWVLNDLDNIAENFPADLDIVDLLALKPEEVRARIELRDVIFVVGGHTDYLMHVFDQTGFSKLLPDLLEQKVYVGSSAGSMVLGKRVSAEAYLEVYGEEGDYGTKRYLELVDLAIKPHLDSNFFPNNRAEILKRVSKGVSGRIYGLRDDSAILVDGDRFKLLGSKPVIVEDGRVVNA